MSEEQAAQIRSLESTAAQHVAEIDALKSLVADLMVAHAMTNGDARPLTALREYTEYAHRRMSEGGTDRTPAEFFEARYKAYGSVLQDVLQSEMASRYWVRSAWEWLDTRRYEENQRSKEAIDRIADWSK